MPVLGLAAGGALLVASAPATGEVDPEIPPEDPIGEVEDTASDLLDEVTDLTCELTDNLQICKLNILTYQVRTDYLRPDNTHRIRYTEATIDVLTPIDASGDLKPDLNVMVTAVTPTHVRFSVQRLLFAPAKFPLTVEALINDPSEPGRLINVGYDTHATTAPKRWTAKAALVTGTSLKVDAELEATEPPSSMTVLGGVYVPGDGEERLNPQQARLTYTPVPATSGIAFTLEDEQDTAKVSAATQTTAELDLELSTGADGKHINAVLQKLNKPVGVLLDKVDEEGQQTDGETGDSHIRVTTQNDVAQAKLLYEESTDNAILKRVRIKAGAIPGQTDVTTTADGVVVDTDEPIDLVAGGVAEGKPAIFQFPLWIPAVPVPPEAPVESPWASYVHHDTTAGVKSTTFRVAGVEHVDVATTGTGDDRKIEIGARLASAPLNVRVTDDSGTGSLYDVDIKDLPHNLKFAFAAKQSNMVHFCGSSNDAEDPCSPQGQQAPAGIDKVEINPSHTAEPIFGQATKLDGVILDIPPVLDLHVDTHVPGIDPNDDDPTTKVHIDASHPIGHVTLRATDGTLPLLADPADNGVIYHETPTRYAVIAKIDGFRWAHLESRPGPELLVVLKAAGGHELTFDANLPDEGGQLKTTGSLPNRPAQTYFALKRTGPVTLIDTSGWNADDELVPIPQVEFDLERPQAFLGDATRLHAEVTDVPSPNKVTIHAVTPGPDDPQKHTKVAINADRAIGQVILRATNGGTAPADPTDNGVIYREPKQPGDQYAVVAKVDGFKSASLESDPDPGPDPDLTLVLAAEEGHDFSYDVHKLTDSGLLKVDGVMLNRPYRTDFDLQTHAKGVMTLAISGSTAEDPPVPVPTPRVILNLENPTKLFGRARFLHADVEDIQPGTLLTIDTITDPELYINVTAEPPIGELLFRATEDKDDFPADPLDNGVIYQEQEDKKYALIAKVSGFEEVNLGMDTVTDEMTNVTRNTLKAALLTDPGHDFSYAIHLKGKEGAETRDFTGFVQKRPARTAFTFTTDSVGLMKINVLGETKSGEAVTTPRLHLQGHISDDPFDKIHNVVVSLKGIPSPVEFVKNPALADALDINLTTPDDWPLESADVQLDNGKLFGPGDIPPLGADESGVLLISDPKNHKLAGDDVFFLRARVRQLKEVTFTHDEAIDALVDVAVPQDFRLFVNKGMGRDHKENVNDCDDWNPAAHNGAHVETHEAFVKNLQPGTTFHYESGESGPVCDRESWRIIEYSAEGHADVVRYRTNAGDLAFLQAETGKTYFQNGQVLSPLPVPKNVRICQATNDHCYVDLGYSHQCKIFEVEWGFCSTKNADATVSAESFGETARIDVQACLVNKDPSNFAYCTKEGVQKGVFADLYASHVDLGYHYDISTGNGFWASNTQAFGKNLGVNGSVDYVNHIKFKSLKHANINFGWEGQRWDPTSNTRFNSYYVAFVVLIPAFATLTGEAQCVGSDLGPTLEDNNSWLKFVLHDDEDAIGLIKTGMLCGFE